MPDSTETTTTPKVSPELKEALAKAKGSVPKKILYWILGAFGVLAAIIGLVFIFKKGKGPIKDGKEAVRKTKEQLAKADMDEKIKVAEAKKAEKEVVDKLKEIKEIKDEDKRLEELNKLL